METCTDIHHWEIDITPEEIAQSALNLGVDIDSIPNLAGAVDLALKLGPSSVTYEDFHNDMVQTLRETVHNLNEENNSLAAVIAWQAAEDEGQRALQAGHYDEREAESCEPSVPLALSIMQKNNMSLSGTD